MALSDLGAVVRAALSSAGLGPVASQVVAEVVCAGERDGCHSHGLFRVPGYLHTLRTGQFDPAQPPTAVPEGGRGAGVVVVDVHGGFAPPAFRMAEADLVQRARQYGVAVCILRRARHFSALWWEVEELASQGFVALAFVNSRAFVAHRPGGTKPVYGTNPMAFSCPRGPGENPIVFDQASAAMARGEVQLLQRAGDLLPADVAIDVHGQPTQDPTAALAGAQIPFGKHKGTSIALMVELLAGALTQSPLAVEAMRAQALEDEDLPPGGAPTENGEIIIAMDPSAIGLGTLGDFTSRVELLIDLIKQDPGGPDLRLPSERRYRNRAETLARGGVVHVPEYLFSAIAK